MCKGLVAGVQGKTGTPGWVEQREYWPYAHSQHLVLLGHPGGLPGGGVSPFTYMPSLSDHSLLGTSWLSCRGFLFHWYPDLHGWKVEKE